MIKSDPREEIVTHIPALRAFALSLTRNATAADDLVQETLMKGWAHIDRYQVGTTMRAWLFTILRNTYYSDMRKSGREIGYDETQTLVELSVAPDHDGRLAMREFQIAFAQLPLDQREALALITMIGVSYEEAAATCGVAVGTIKSRVNRGRAQLVRILKLDDDVSPV